MTGLGNLATPHSGTAVRNTLKFGALSLFTREGQEKIWGRYESFRGGHRFITTTPASSKKRVVARGCNCLSLAGPTSCLRSFSPVHSMLHSSPRSGLAPDYITDLAPFFGHHVMSVLLTMLYDRFACTPGNIIKLYTLSHCIHVCPDYFYTML